MILRMIPGMYERVNTAQHAQHAARHSVAQNRRVPHCTAGHGTAARLS